MIFEFRLKTIIPETKHYEIKGKHMLFRKMRYYIHSDKVKKKQENCEIKYPQSS